jgi:hypothetical protein
VVEKGASNAYTKLYCSTKEEEEEEKRNELKLQKKP